MESDMVFFLHSRYHAVRPSSRMHYLHITSPLNVLTSVSALLFIPLWSCSWPLLRDRVKDPKLDWTLKSCTSWSKLHVR